MGYIRRKRELRTTVIAVLTCLLVFTVAPAASFAETSQETAPENLQASYYTKDDKHFVEVQLSQAEQPEGNWIVTLNGSNEQSSPEGSQLDKYTTDYDDLIKGRNYQVIAVFYGQNGDKPIDLNACFQFEAKQPTSGLDNQVQLKSCGFEGIPAPSEPVSSEFDSVDESEDLGKKPEGEEPQRSKSTDKEETGSLEHLNSTQKQGGEMPQTALPISGAFVGAQLIGMGCVVLGNRRSGKHNLKS